MPTSGSAKCTQNNEYKSANNLNNWF